MTRINHFLAVLDHTSRCLHSHVPMNLEMVNLERIDYMGQRTQMLLLCSRFRRFQDLQFRILGFLDSSPLPFWILIRRC